MRLKEIALGTLPVFKNASWLDDLTARAEQSAQNAANNVTDWLSNATADAVIKTGDKALGNQTALDIANGQPGAQKPIAQGSGNPASANAAPYPTAAKGIAISLPIILLAGVAFYFLWQKA